LLKFYSGALTLSDLSSLGYKDSCNFFNYAVKITVEENESIKNG
jgi:hypothetical protein